jgi:hypothetical protein
MLVANIISCLILVLVLRLVYKITSKVVTGRDGVRIKTKINTLVTVSHICVTLVYTFTQILVSVEKNEVQALRMNTALYFFAGLADIFLSLMLWFILDDAKEAIVYIDGDRVYSIEEIIASNHSSINQDGQDLKSSIAQIEASSSIYESFNTLGISQRMIKQFITK